MERTDTSLQVEIDGWPSKPYWLRLVRVPALLKAELHGGTVLDAEYNQKRNTLNLLVEGRGVLRLTRAGVEGEQQQR